jgi:hypothetical protein
MVLHGIATLQQHAGESLPDAGLTVAEGPVAAAAAADGHADTSIDAHKSSA